MFRKIFNIFKNKFVFITLGFLVWIIVFDKNNLLSQIEHGKKLQLLKNDKKYFIDEIKKNEKDTKELLSDPHDLEKFARETYLMKRDSEDIFLIIQNDSLAKLYN